jgi:hypothetical protein
MRAVNPSCTSLLSCDGHPDAKRGDRIKECQRNKSPAKVRLHAKVLLHVSRQTKR